MRSTAVEPEGLGVGHLTYDITVDDLEVVAGGRDMPAYSSPLLECLPPVMVISFLGEVGRRDRNTPLLDQSLLELHGKRSRA